MNKKEIEKAINYFKNATISFATAESGLQAMKVRDLAVFALTQQLNNGWIPISSGILPKEYRDEHRVLIPYIVCVNGTERPFRAFYDGKKWGDGMFKIDVTAWQPLPGSYKEVSDTKDNNSLTIGDKIRESNESLAVFAESITHCETCIMSAKDGKPYCTGGKQNKCRWRILDYLNQLTSSTV